MIELNEKPALLLRFLLQEADKIHSKAELLESVWPDRVVTEQVVFQNISYLRAKFGDDAIKTFSKKGYQWQLPLTLVEQEGMQDSPDGLSKASELQEVVSSHNQQPNNKSDSYSIRAKLIASSLILFVVVIALWLSSNQHNQVDKGKNEPLAKIYLIDDSTKTLSNEVSEQGVSAQTLFDSPYSTWQQQTSNNKQWLVATKLYQVKDKVALRFHIQGAKRSWHDYILAADKQEARAKLEALLTTLLSTNYFNVPLEHTALAELTLLVYQEPEYELLNDQRIRLHFKLNDMDRASALVDQQLTKETSRLRQGLLQLLKAKINLWNKNDLAAEESGKIALGIFKELNLPHLESRALIELSWVHLVKNEFRQGMQVLNQAAGKARTSDEPLLEVTAHLNQSFMASKADKVDLSHTQLGLAKELIELHQLGSEHQVRVLNNLDWIAETAEERIAHNQSILDMPYSPQYGLYFYIAAEKVRDSHLKNQAWDQALATIKSWQRLSFQALSKSHIAFAQDNWQQGVNYAKEAYQQAQASHHKIDALDAALILLQRQIHADNAIDVSEYDTYIKQNATNRWLDQNRFALEEINKGND